MIRNLLALCFVLLAFLSGHCEQLRADDTTFKPAAGSYAVDVRSVKLRDDERGKQVSVRLYNHSSYDGRAGSEAQTRISHCVKTATLVFWDAHLKENSLAKEFLESGRLLRSLAGVAKLSSK